MPSGRAAITGKQRNRARTAAVSKETATKTWAIITLQAMAPSPPHPRQTQY